MTRKADDTARRITEAALPAAGKEYHADPHGEWVLTRDPNTGAVTYQFPRIGAHFTLENPERFAEAFLMWSRPEHRAVLLGPEDEIVIGTDAGDDLEPSIEGSAEGAMHTFSALLGYNLAEAVIASCEEAEVVSGHISNAVHPKTLAPVTEGDLEASVTASQVVAQAVAPGMERRRERLRGMMARVPESDPLP